MSLLKIPRKQNLVGGAISSSLSPSTDTAAGGSIDKAHLEKALLENFLSIERWANQQSVSVCMSQSSTHKSTGSVPQSATGPWTVLWDQYELANTTGNLLRVPGPGIYLAQGSLNAGNLAASTPGTLGWVNFAIGGGSSFMTPTQVSITDHGVTSNTTSGTAVLGIAELTVSGFFLASTAGYIGAGFNSNSTAMDVDITGFGFVRLGEIPSKTQ